MASLPSSSSTLLQRNPNYNFIFLKSQTPIRKKIQTSTMVVSATSTITTTTEGEGGHSQSQTTKLVTFLGKGGSGKTTSAVLAAQCYANAGLKTCLVVHSQDRSADYLLGSKIGTGSSPTVFTNNLSAVRLETTKMLLEPLNQLKQADARLKLTQGILEGVVGEELGVLPGMDSIFTALALEKFVEFLGRRVVKGCRQQERFDVVIYDGISNEETLRMIGATERARWYLKYLRNMAEKTDIGRLIAPTILRLIEETLWSNGSAFRLEETMSAKIWNSVERILERASAAFVEPSKFNCYLMMDLNSPISVNSALRYWGCATQSGAHISGAFAVRTPQSSVESEEIIEKKFSPLPFAVMPYISTHTPVDWDAVGFQKDACNLLLTAASDEFQSSVKFDTVKKSVTLFMPGFDKSEIKLYQYRGGSELLVEVGDQRRVICLPSGIQGKVGGAKFTDQSLVITMR